MLCKCICELILAVDELRKGMCPTRRGGASLQMWMTMSVWYVHNRPPRTSTIDMLDFHPTDDIELFL